MYDSKRSTSQTAKGITANCRMHESRQSTAKTANCLSKYAEQSPDLELPL